MEKAITITADDVSAALERVGLMRGDTVCTHSFLGAFGRLENGAETILNGFKKTLGPEGTLIVPTFNYDFFPENPTITY